MGIRNIGCEGVDLIQLTQNRIQKKRKYRDQLSDYQLLKENRAVGLVVSFVEMSVKVYDMF